MKRATFNIRRESGKPLQKQGYIFSLPYPKRFIFAVAKEGNEINSSIRWVVSEMSSGYAVAFGKWDGTRKAAISKATKVLRQQGVKELKQQSHKIVVLYGVAN